jgi:hypothetical protein
MEDLHFGRAPWVMFPHGRDTKTIIPVDREQKSTTVAEKQHCVTNDFLCMSIQRKTFDSIGVYFVTWSHIILFSIVGHQVVDLVM